MSVNPDLALSTEFGAGDFERKEQVFGRAKFDWRDWLNDVELETMLNPAQITLAVSRFNTVSAALDKDAALINLKLTVMHASVSRE